MMRIKNLAFSGNHGILSLFVVAAVLFQYGCSNNNSGNAAESVSDTSTINTGQDGFVTIFDGQSLDGWEGSPDNWKVDDGAIVGYTSNAKPLENNTFLIWRNGQPGDFELKLEFKISAKGNSGVQYRSEELKDPPLALKGYQADIDGNNTYTGQNYEERGRGFLAKRGEIALLKTGEDPTITGSLGDGDELKAKINHEDWNTLHIIVEGNHLKHYVNDVLMSEVIDEDPNARKMQGHLGLQVHKGPPMEVRYRNIQYKNLNGQ